jgi:hypothetical protein
MTDIESLCRLTEAVEAAGADIAPTYLEYVQLSFAIATDCGEAGREFFHRLCRVSPKYQREHAERVFSNALHTQRGEVHLGTAFHLAEATGVAISYVETVGTVRTAPQILTQARAYNKVANEETDEETITEEKEELLSGSDPQHPLPTLPEANWPKLLQRIIKVAKNEIQRDIMLMGAFTALGACMSRHVRCLYGGKYYYPSLQCFIVSLQWPCSDPMAVDSVSASDSKISPVPSESIMFCRMPVPVLLPEIKNILLGGICGTSIFDRSFPIASYSAFSFL